MSRWNIFWQDLVCVVAGAWLMISVGAQITPETLYSGGLAYLTGALMVLLSVAAVVDRSPALSWAVSVAGLVAVATPLLTGLLDDAAAALSFFVAGALAVIFGSWSALRKRRSEERPSERETSATSPATTTVGH